MFRLSLLSIVVLVLNVIVANVAPAQCNSGVSTQQAQIQANQALVLQQTAAIAAQQQAARQASTLQPRTVFSQPVGLTQLAAAPACATCSQQVAAVPRPVSQQPLLVLTMPGSNTPAPPGRYVIAKPLPSGMTLARN